MDNVSYLPPEVLRQAIFDLVAETRHQLANGTIDLSKMEQGVKAYCMSIASLPVEEGRNHARDLAELMEVLTHLGNELKQAKEEAKQQLESMDNVKRAHVAYQRSDAMGEKPVKSEDDE